MGSIYLIIGLVIAISACADPRIEMYQKNTAIYKQALQYCENEVKRMHARYNVFELDRMNYDEGEACSKRAWADKRELDRMVDNVGIPVMIVTPMPTPLR